MYSETIAWMHDWNDGCYLFFASISTLHFVVRHKLIQIIRS